MSLLDEWRSIREVARRVADDLVHVDATTYVVRGGALAAVTHTHTSLGGDVDTFVDPAADGAILALHAEAAGAVIELHEARVALVAGVAGAAL